MKRSDAIVVAMTNFLIANGALAQTLEIVDDIPGTFIDISITGGTPLQLGSDDEVGVGSFTGSFALQPGLLVVANNGGLGFGTKVVTDLQPDNQPIPSNNAFGGGQALLAFWDDIDDDIDDKNGDVFFAQFVMEDNIMTIVQWNDLPVGSNPDDIVTFQIQICENLDPAGVYAQFIYKDVEQLAANGGASATIGYQDGGAGFGDVEWSFNEANAVSNGTVLSLVIREPHAEHVPTLSDWGIVILTLLLLTAATIIFGRQRYRPSESGDSNSM
ncbi:MAG: IPTL-CTERM sorting domain-containing protein [Phycisphaerales bacterium]|nr:IPTL-CTERM sorting domain-containing protein [Phycisphaerales bacterium]